MIRECVHVEIMTLPFLTKILSQEQQENIYSLSVHKSDLPER